MGARSATRTRLTRRGAGIAGAVYQTGEILNVEDAYADARFNKEADIASGYRTRSLLCSPVCAKDGRIVAVLQAVNKLRGDGDRDAAGGAADHDAEGAAAAVCSFTEEDEVIIQHLAGQVSNVLVNTKLFQEVQEAHKQVGGPRMPASPAPPRADRRAQSNALLDIVRAIHRTDMGVSSLIFTVQEVRGGVWVGVWVRERECRC